ncbi:MAG: hypothetical protein EOO73_00860 [Myxococcales bacterium]|nr:MAG: hypothetical protein EOO73_00860 [Myxococcales bacterium]
MNIKHSITAPVSSGTRSTLRRLVVAAATGAMMLGLSVSTASADAVKKYSLKGGTNIGFSINGEGQFTVREADGNIAFDSHVGGCKQLKMFDKRQDHTCNPAETKIAGMKADSVAKLVVSKKDLKYPAAGKKESGKVSGKVHFLGKSSDAKVEYTVEGKGNDTYTISNARFTFDYTKHTNEVCFAGACVKKDFEIKVDSFDISTKH